MSIQSGLDLIWSSDFVQKNPKKAYGAYYPEEYVKVGDYLGGGPEPDFSTFSRLGRGLCEIEKERRGEVVDPPALISSSIKDGDTLTGTINWVVDAANAAAVEFWANDSKLAEDTSMPYSYSLDTTTLPEGTNALGLGIRGLDGSRITPQIGTVTVDNQTEPPIPPGQAIWFADFENGLAKWGDWEFGGTFDGVPKLSERVIVGSEIDGMRPLYGTKLAKFIVAPGDQYGGSTGWRCVSRMPAQSSNGGNIVMRARGYDSAHVFVMALPPGYPFDANEWQSGPEYHHDNKPTNPNVAPFHFRVNSQFMNVDVAGQVGTSRVEYVNHNFFPGYAKNAWYVFAYRYKHELLPNGIFELWGGLAGVDSQMKLIVSKSGIATMYPDSLNYELVGHYRGQSGVQASYLYFNLKAEYATLAEALAFANGLL